MENDVIRSSFAMAGFALLTACVGTVARAQEPATTGAGTMTCVGAITLTGEGVTLTNTGVFKATIDASATATLHRCMVYATILNSQATGITIS